MVQSQGTNEDRMPSSRPENVLEEAVQDGEKAAEEMIAKVEEDLHLGPQPPSQPPSQPQSPANPQA